MNDGEIVERLRRHYKENVLPLQSLEDPKFGKLKEKLESPRTFKKAVVAGLNRAVWKTAEIRERDVDGSELMEVDADLSMVAITIPEIKADLLMEKLGSEGAGALTVFSFEEGSPFYGTAVVLVPDNQLAAVNHRHEQLHVLDERCSRSLQEISSMFEPDEKGKRYWELFSLRMERELVGELLSTGITDGEINAHARSFFSRYYAQNFADEAYETGVIPACGAVSRHAAKNTVEKAAQSYIGDVIDAGNRAFRILRRKLPEEKLIRGMIGCGPTQEEIESGKHFRPFEELSLLSKYHKGVFSG